MLLYCAGLVFAACIGLVALGCELSNCRLRRSHQTAVYACAEMRNQAMRGSAILRLTRRNVHYRADKLIEVAIINGRPYAFTDSVLPSAAKLYDSLVSSGELDPVTRPT